MAVGSPRKYQLFDLHRWHARSHKEHDQVGEVIKAHIYLVAQAEFANDLIRVTGL